MTPATVNTEEVKAAAAVVLGNVKARKPPESNKENFRIWPFVVIQFLCHHCSRSKIKNGNSHSTSEYEYRGTLGTASVVTNTFEPKSGSRILGHKHGNVRVELEGLVGCLTEDVVPLHRRRSM